MKLISLAALTATFLFLISFSSASFTDQILNGNFSNYNKRTEFVPQYFGAVENTGAVNITSCQGANLTSSYFLPNTWSFTNWATYLDELQLPAFNTPLPPTDNYLITNSTFHISAPSFIAYSIPFYHLISQTGYTCGGNCLTTGPECSYNNSGGNVNKLGLGASTVPAVFYQTVTLKDSFYKLHIWARTAPDMLYPDLHATSPQSATLYYTCARSSNGGQFGVNGQTCELITGQFGVFMQLDDPVDGRNAAGPEIFLGSSAIPNCGSVCFKTTDQWQEYIIDFGSSSLDLSNKNVTIVFTIANLDGSLNHDSGELNSVAFDDISLEHYGNGTVLQYLRDVNTLSPIAYTQSMGTTSSYPALGGVNLSSLTITNNISNFYGDFIKVNFVVNVTPNGTNTFFVDGGQDVRPQFTLSNGTTFNGSAGGTWLFRYFTTQHATIPACVDWIIFNVTGYVPANTAILGLRVDRMHVNNTINCASEGPRTDFQINWTLNPTTLASRNTWKMPIVDRNYQITKSFPITFFNFTYDSNANTLNYWAYNWYNTSFYFPNLATHDDDTTNITMCLTNKLVCDNNTQPFHANSTYANFNTFIQSSGGTGGDDFLTNRTTMSPYFWYYHGEGDTDPFVLPTSESMVKLKVAGSDCNDYTINGAVYKAFFDPSTKTCYWISQTQASQTSVNGGPCPFGQICPPNSSYVANVTTNTAFDPAINLLLYMPFWLNIVPFFAMLVLELKFRSDGRGMGLILFGGMLMLNVIYLAVGIYIGLVGIALGSAIAALFGFLFWFSVREGVGLAGGGE